MGRKGQAEIAAPAWLLEMSVKDCLTIYSRPGSPSCKGSLFSEMFES